MLSNDRLGSADAYPGIPGERANADADWAGSMPVFGAGCETAAGERRARAGRGGSGRARQIHKSAGQNAEMLRRFCPGMADTPQLWLGRDKNHSPSNTGDGHRMGMWIGAKLQDSPHAPCAHHM